MSPESKRFLPFFLIMAVVIIALIFVLILVGYWYPCLNAFYQDFLPKFLATLLGVVVSTMFAVVTWFYQQNAHNKIKRENLIAKLKSEVKANLNTLNDSQFLKIDEWYKKDLDELIKLSNKIYNLPPLRKSTINYVFQPDNFVLIDMPSLEPIIELAIEYINRYNSTPIKLFNELPMHTSDDSIKSYTYRVCSTMSINYTKVVATLESLITVLQDNKLN
jgi:hypothetical protein